LKALLDTHIWIWALDDYSKLLPAVANVLEDPQNELWLSPISVWEVLRLHERGRAEFGKNVVEWISRALVALPVTEAPLTNEVALRTHSLRLQHSDPADTFLAATASVFDLTLITADRHLLASKQIRTLANR
jgi:PIN domain nuclease of toxin-antitoxin system